MYKHYPFPFALALAICFVASIVFTAEQANAQNSDREVFRFLDLPTSARLSSLGGNHAALFGGDVSEFQVNPAYLSTSSNNDLSLSYINFLTDVNFAFANWSHQLNDIGMLGVAVRYLSLGDFQRTNELGDILGDFNANELAFTVGLGRSLGERIHYGANIDFIYSSLDTFNSTALAFTAGGIFITEAGNTSFGLTFKNAGFQISEFNSKNEDLPFDILLGVSHDLQHTPLRFSFTLQKLDEWDLEVPDDDGNDPDFLKNAVRHAIIGAELLLSENIHLRIGYNQFMHDNLSTSDRLDTAGMNFGLGINIKEFTFDIGRSSFSEIGGSTQISLKTTF